MAVVFINFHFIDYRVAAQITLQMLHNVTYKYLHLSNMIPSISYKNLIHSSIETIGLKSTGPVYRLCNVAT